MNDTDNNPDDANATKRCAHRSCTCELPASSRKAWCSEHCREASERLGHPEDHGVPEALGMTDTPPAEACRCGHLECAESALATDSQDAQSSAAPA